MKKIVILLFSLSLLFSVSFVSALASWEENLLAVSTCDTTFTQTERTQLYNLADFLYNKNSSIENKFPGTTALTNSFAEKIYTSLEQNCASDIFKNYKEFQQGFASYIAHLVWSQNIKTFQPDTEAEQAILQLQHYIVKILTSGYDIRKAYKLVSTTDFDVDLAIAEMGINIDTNAHIETDGKYNLAKQEFDINLALDLLLKWEQSDLYSKNSGTLNVGLDANLVQKDDLFVAINALNLDINTDELEPAEQMQVAMAQNMVDTTISKIQWKYINISKNIKQYASALYTDTLMNPQLLLNNFANTAIFDFYKNDNVRYGKLNTNICKTLEKIWLDAESCKEKINMMNIKTQWKGYLILQKEGTEYKLGLTDKFSPEKISTNLNYNEIIARDSNNITSMHIPLDKENPENKITYNNNLLDIKYNNDDINVWLHGTINNQTKSFQLKINFADDIVLDADIVYNNIWSTTTTSMDAVVTQNDIKIGSFKLDNEEVITYLQSLVIQKPTNTISIEELKNILPDM